jgi:tetratricopeptide (TPR) repeat protein
MTFLAGLFRVALTVLLLAGLNGCLPSSQSPLEEEKESHFLAGKSCINSMDYKGATEEFKMALKVNPDSASAHIQLGWLYEEKDPDPAAAIYHYQEFLKLRPNADNAEVIRQHINNCKQDLAKTVLPLPVTPGMQHEFEQLAEENKRLHDELEKWRAYASRLQALTNPPAPPAVAARAGPIPSPLPAPQTNSGQQNSAGDPRPPAGAGAARAYVIKSGDSAYSIARKYGVKLDALLTANPGLDPKRLRPGQTLNLPPP